MKLTIITSAFVLTDDKLSTLAETTINGDAEGQSDSDADNK